MSAKDACLKRLNEVNALLVRSQADVQRLSSETLVETGRWMDLQQQTNEAFGTVSRLQSELGNSLILMQQARVTIVALIEELNIERNRSVMQA